LICNVLGTPSQEDLRGVTSQKALNFLYALKPRDKVDWSSLYPKATDEARELLAGLLSFAPEPRLSVEQALGSRYLESLHDPADEPEGVGSLDFEWVLEP